jgi:hypothetical protein
MNTTTMRELDRSEIDQLSGGYLPAIGISTATGALVGGLSYGYDLALSGGSFDGSLFVGSVLQGAVTGFLVGVGGVMFTVPGGTVAGVSAEGLATVITITDPSDSLE